MDWRLGMQCCDIHEDWVTRCETDLDATYHFCPECGRPAGHVVVPSTIDVVAVAGDAHTATVSIPCRGYQRIAVSVEFRPRVTGAGLQAQQGTILYADPRRLLQISVQLPPLKASHIIGRLIVRAWDGPPSLNGPAERRIAADVHAQVRSRGGLDVEQTVLYFRDGNVERSLVLRNTGLSPVDFDLADIPLGYRATPTQGRVPAMEGGQPGRQTIKVMRDLSVRDAEPLSTLSIQGADKTAHTVSLRWLSGPGIRLTPRAVVGIDLGTSYTSVAFRDCRNHPDQRDDVVFLAPPGHPDTRFRTYIWLGRNGSFLFGPDAHGRYETTPGAGYLFREAKLLLRAPEQVMVHPTGDEVAATRHAVQQLGDEWGVELITAYMKWLLREIVQRELRERYGTEQTPVQYVFSIPVLDYSLGQETLYQRQRSAMERCVRQAGFPDDFEALYPFEPTCAATALLHPPHRAEDWPTLGDVQWPLQRETRIAVFDSGGGTTDLILGRLSVGDGGRLELSVDRCLGVGGEHETFGGERITETMKLWLLDRPIDHASSYTGLHIGPIVREHLVSDADLLAEDADNQDDRSSRDLRGLQVMDELKARLSTHDEEWLTVHEELKLHRDLPSRICETPLGSLSRTVEAHLFHGLDPTNVRYYLDVGGNTRLPAVVRWLERTMGDHDGASSTRHLRIPDDQRQLAVARGAAWIPNAGVRDPLPMDIQLVVIGSDGDVVAERRWDRDLPMSGYGQPRSIPLQVGAAQHIGIEVRCGPSGDHGRIGVAEWRNPDSHTTGVTLTCRIDHGAISVTAASDHAQDQDAVLLECPL